GSLVLSFLDDHLPLGKIADHHGPFSQSVCDEMGSFVQTVALLAPLLFGYSLVDLGEMDVSTRFLLALVPLGTNLVQLLVVPTIALEAANVIEAPLIVDSGCQRLDAQVKGHDTLIAQGTLLLAPLACLVLVIIFVLLGI